MAKIKKKGKKKKKNKKPSQRWKLYEIKEGKIIRKNKFCPRCGPGVFLLKAKNRLYCGKCHYTEYIKNEE